MCSCLRQVSFTDDLSSLQEIFGGNAVSDEYGIGRHVANLFVTQTYEGQSDIHCKYPDSVAAISANTATSFDSWKSDHRNPSILLSSVRRRRQKKRRARGPTTVLSKLLHTAV